MTVRSLFCGKRSLADVVFARGRFINWPFATRIGENQIDGDEIRVIYGRPRYLGARV